MLGLGTELWRLGREADIRCGHEPHTRLPNKRTFNTPTRAVNTLAQ